MDLNVFIQQFADLFDETPVETLTPDTEYKELEEWDSMAALTVISMISDEYDVPIMGADLKKAITLQQLYDIVKERVDN
jgi:acyl carrier protein